MPREVPRAPLSNLGVCPIGVAPRLHQYGVHGGAGWAPRGGELPHDSRPFHEVCPRGGDEGPDCQDCCEGVLQVLHGSFGAPARLLSDRGASFTSALVEELCATFGIQKCRTTAYHAQCNGQVEHFHQTLFCMIGKLACDVKAQWE